MNFLYQPWPWYIAGPLIGLTVPALLIAGNKMLGISSTLRQICAISFPANIEYLKFDWKKQKWNLFFVLGVFLGGFLAGYVFANPEPVKLSAPALNQMHEWNIHPQASLLPKEIFSWQSLLTIRGWLIIVLGGFLVGFGTRYAGGCTSGHGIMGLASLQWTSLLATVSFFVGGILTSWFLLPFF